MAKQQGTTPRPGGLNRPEVVCDVRANAGTGAGHGAGPRFTRRVAMYTDRPAFVRDRRDRYSGIKRGALFHAEMSSKKQLILKK